MPAEKTDESIWNRPPTWNWKTLSGDSNQRPLLVNLRPNRPFILIPVASFGSSGGERHEVASARGGTPRRHVLDGIAARTQTPIGRTAGRRGHQVAAAEGGARRRLGADGIGVAGRCRRARRPGRGRRGGIAELAGDGLQLLAQLPILLEELLVGLFQLLEPLLDRELSGAGAAAPGVAGATDAGGGWPWADTIGPQPMASMAATGRPVQRLFGATIDRMRATSLGWVPTIPGTSARAARLQLGSVLRVVPFEGTLTILA